MTSFEKSISGEKNYQIDLTPGTFSLSEVIGLDNSSSSFPAPGSIFTTIILMKVWSLRFCCYLVLEDKVFLVPCGHIFVNFSQGF